MIDRRTFLAGTGVLLLAASLVAEAQQAGRVPRIGILDPGIPHLFAAFREAMRQLGYVEGQNIAFEVRSAQGRPEQIPALAAELAKLGPDVIVSAAKLPLNALKQETRSIPIAAAAIGDAVATGLVKNLAKPDGNITGLSFLNTELSGKRLEVLRQTFPKIRRVAMLNDSNNEASYAVETERAAQRLGVQLQRLDVRSPTISSVPSTQPEGTARTRSMCLPRPSSTRIASESSSWPRALGSPPSMKAGSTQRRAGS